MFSFNFIYSDFPQIFHDNMQQFPGLLLRAAELVEVLPRHNLITFKPKRQ